MPAVIRYEQSAKLAPNYQEGLTTKANAEQMGAAIGRGMQDIAQGIGRVASTARAVQDLDDETRAKEADDKFSDAIRSEMYDPEKGFMNQTGKNAVDGWEGFQKRVDELRNEYSKNLPPGAVRLYDDVSKRRVDGVLQTGMVHTNGQRKAWVRDASESRLQTFQNDAIVAYNDPKLVEKGIASGLAELQQAAQLQGWDSDTLKSKQQEYASSVRRNVVMRLANDDPLAADAYFKKHKDRMTGADQYALTKALDEAVTTAKAEKNAGDILGNYKKVDGPKWQGSLVDGIAAAAKALGVEALDLATAISYETGGTFDPVKKGPRTQWGQHKGLIQWGEPQAEKYGVNWADAIGSQLGPAGAVVKYLKDAGVVPGMGLKDIYSAINAGRVGRYSASDANNGGAWGTVADKVKYQMGGHRRNAEKLLGGQLLSASASDMEEKLQSIKDPKEREATRRYLSNMMEAESKQRKAQQDAAEMQLFTTVEQGGTPDDLPLEVRLMAGQSAMSSAWSYHEAKLKRGQPETDQELLYALRRRAAEAPNEFAQENLLQYRPHLDDSAFKELTDAQTSVLKNDVQAVQTGKVYADAYKQAEDKLEAVGITTRGLDSEKKIADRQAMSARIATFQNALKDQIDLFRAKNNQSPTYAETQQMINNLLMPVLIRQQKEKSNWDITKTPWTKLETADVPGMAFDYKNAPAGAEIVVKYKDIDPDTRRVIEADMQKELGRLPTPEEVEDRFLEIFMGSE